MRSCVIHATAIKYDLVGTIDVNSRFHLGTVVGDYQLVVILCIFRTAIDFKAYMLRTHIVT